MAKERQVKRRAKIRADSELHQAQLLRVVVGSGNFVVGKLARSVGLSVSSSSKKRISAESEAKRELAHTFYRTDDVHHGKLLERKNASSFVKQQRQERGSSKHSKSAT